MDEYIQIIPATNTVAVFKGDNGRKEEYPVLCWALVLVKFGDGADWFREVRGLIAQIGSSSLIEVEDYSEGGIKYTFDGYEGGLPS